MSESPSDGCSVRLMMGESPSDGCSVRLMMSESPSVIWAVV